MKTALSLRPPAQLDEAELSCDAHTEQILEDRMRPGAWSEKGFLGINESLAEIIAQDTQALERQRLSHNLLADKLEALFTAVLALYRQPLTESELPRALARQTSFPNLYHPETLPHFDLQNLPDPQSGYIFDNLQIFIVCYKGWQECPWGDEAKGTCDFMILNRTTGTSVTAPELMPHLIRDHHFFEGHGTPFRTDPELLMDVLNLVN